MFEIPDIDLAWEAVHELKWSLTSNGTSADVIDKALRAIEQAGGKDPSPQRIPAVVEALFVRLYRKYSHERPQDPVASADIDVHNDEIVPAAGNTPVDLTITRLVTSYLGTNRPQAYRTRQNYEKSAKRIEREHGDQLVSDIKKETLQRWYAEWHSGGRVSNASSMMWTLSNLFRFGTDALKDDDCERLSGLIRVIHVERTKPRAVQKMTEEQVKDFVAQAHKMGAHSLALAQALQFEVGLGQKQVIGEWVPNTEPGTSEITDGDRKWRRGLLWSDIGANQILRKEGKTVKLRLCRLVLAELERLGSLPTIGAMIISERSGLPYIDHNFRYYWRKIARAAGIPKHVFNMDSPKRRRGKEVEADAAKEVRASERHEKVSAILPRGLPDHVRSDVLQDMLLDLHTGALSEEDLVKKRRQYLTKHYARYSDRFKTVSLDETIPGTNLRRSETISSDSERGF